MSQQCMYCKVLYVRVNSHYPTCAVRSDKLLAIRLAAKRVANAKLSDARLDTDARVKRIKLEKSLKSTKKELEELKAKTLQVHQVPQVHQVINNYTMNVTNNIVNNSVYAIGTNTVNDISRLIGDIKQYPQFKQIMSSNPVSGVNACLEMIKASPQHKNAVEVIGAHEYEVDDTAQGEAIADEIDNKCAEARESIKNYFLSFATNDDEVKAINSTLNANTMITIEEID